MPFQLDPISIARVCHEANRAYCLALGDTSQVPWDDAPEWQKASAIDGVEKHLASPNGLPPSASHDAWLAQKRQDGWKYGPAKDAEKREHPCFVPYEDLPEEQKRKDTLFGKVVEALRP